MMSPAATADRCGSQKWTVRTTRRLPLAIVCEAFRPSSRSTMEKRSEGPLERTQPNNSTSSSPQPSQADTSEEECHRRREPCGWALPPCSPSLPSLRQRRAFGRLHSSPWFLRPGIWFDHDRHGRYHSRLTPQGEAPDGAPPKFHRHDAGSSPTYA